MNSRWDRGDIEERRTCSAPPQRPRQGCGFVSDWMKRESWHAPFGVTVRILYAGGACNDESCNCPRSKRRRKAKRMPLAGIVGPCHERERFLLACRATHFVRSRVMGETINVGLIGLDSSHTVEFARRMVAPDCPEDQRVFGLRPLTCLRFPSPFQSEAGLDQRQKLLEDWGIKVTTLFREAVAGCDALMLEINDPAQHLEYIEACADLGKMIFLDKPMADSIANGRRILELARSKDLKILSMSSLRLPQALVSACEKMPRPLFAHAFGAYGTAPAGSSIVWYGVHTFEMLQRAMGRGASGVYTRQDGAGVTAVVRYPENRRGVVELSEGAHVYGGVLRDRERAIPFVADTSRTYVDQLVRVEKFFRTGETPLELQDTFEVMAMLDAAQRSLDSGKEEEVGNA